MLFKYGCKFQIPKPMLGSKIRLTYDMMKVKKIVTPSSMPFQPSTPVGAFGYGVVLPRDPRIPETSFFEPGKRFRVRLK